MYSQKIIDNNIRYFEAKNGWGLVRHSFAEVQEFTANMKKLVRLGSNSKGAWIDGLNYAITEKRKMELKRWMENEIVLSSLDYNYWRDNYAYVTDEGGQVVKFKNRRSQDVFDSIVGYLEELQAGIQILCLDPDTKVLTADLRWVRIDDLKVGDELVACDEGQTPEEKNRDIAERTRGKKNGIKRERPKKHINRERKMRTCKVEGKWDNFESALSIQFEDGREIVCSPEHQWLYKRHGNSDPIWRKAKNIKVGEYVRYITELWDEPTYEDGWFGGFVDGEGYLSKEVDNGTDLTVTQRFNVAYDRAKKYLKDRNYTFRQETDIRTPDDSSVLGRDPVGRLIVGRSDELFKLLGQSRPSRFISRRWWEGKTLPGKKTGIGWAKVISVDILPARRLVDIQTSTRTFIAEGFVSHNCLKGRQVGITTLVSLYFGHKMLFIPNTLAVMASVQKSKSDEIDIKLNTAYDMCPFWLVPPRMPKRSFTNGSRLMIESGMQPKGIAQGQTPQAIHISEISIIPNPHNVIEEGLLPATHSNKNIFMVFEGTGSGNVGWFPDFWKSQKSKWPLGTGRMCPVFIPWHLATDMYPQPDWVRAHPIPTGWYEKRMDATKAHIARCESYIRNTPYLAKVCGSNYRVSLEQQYWWELEYDQARERHSLQQHAARLPADDFEALTGVHDSVFDQETIMEVEDDIYEIRTDGARTRRAPFQAYAITGHSISEEFEPSESQIDYSKEVIHLTHKSNRDERYDWELVPLLPIDEESEINTLDVLLVYEPPQKGAIYSCGVDTAHGLGKEEEDRFCASMTKVSSGSGCDTQSCELTSLRFSPAQAVPFLAAMATWYGQTSGHYRGVKFSIEQVEGPGDTCQNQLKIMGFNWHHTPGRLDGKKIKDENRHREGWYSNRTTVPILMNRFVEAVNGGWYIPRSKWLIEELKTLERHIVDGGQDKMIHQKGKHDDRVRAAAQSYLNLHTYDDLTARSQRRYQQPTKKKHDPDKGKCLSNTFSVGAW